MCDCIYVIIWLCNYYVKHGTEVPTKTGPEVEAQNSKIINTLILKEISTLGKRRLGGGKTDRQRETESSGQRERDRQETQTWNFILQGLQFRYIQTCLATSSY